MRGTRPTSGTAAGIGAGRNQHQVPIPIALGQQRVIGEHDRAEFFRGGLLLGHDRRIDETTQGKGPYRTPKAKLGSKLQL
jgi:hypothetical protein